MLKINDNEISVSKELYNVNEEVLNQLRKEAKKDTYHWFKMKMEDGSELDLVEKKYFEKLQQENKQLKEEIEKYKTTIEIYQPYFKGIDLVKEIEKMQELESSDNNE